MFRYRSIVTHHYLISLLVLAYVLCFVYAGIVFTGAMENDGELINLAGSIRYRSYRLLALVQQAHNPALHSSATVPAASEVEKIRSLFSRIEANLLRDAVGHSQLLRKLKPLNVRWEGRIVPTARRLATKRPAKQGDLLNFAESTEAFVADLDLFVEQLSMHNRSEVRSYNRWRIIFVLLFLPIFLDGFYYTKKCLLGPIVALQEASLRLIEGDLAVRLPITCKNEVGELTERFNRSAASLEMLFNANNVYSKTLDELNRTSGEMISIGNRGEIYQFACNRGLELLDLDMVWLGMFGADSSQLQVVARAGDETNYTGEFPPIVWDDAPELNGPVRRAIRTREPRLARISDDSLWPWRHLAQRHGYNSLLAVPLVTKHDCLGAITFYSKQADFFTHERIELCQILGSHTSAAIEAMNLLHYVVLALARAAEVNDEDTGNHILRVSEYCAVLAEEMGLDTTFVEQIRFQATLHDVGKLYLDPAILKKPGFLSSEEVAAMRQHAVNGAKIIGEHPMLQMAQEIARWHHERWDGSGYPDGLRGEQIPLSARIATVADQYDALRNHRAYKLAFDHRKSCYIIVNGDGRTLPSHFDPEVLAAFARIADRFNEISLSFDKMRDLRG